MAWDAIVVGSERVRRGRHDAGGGRSEKLVVEAGPDLTSTEAFGSEPGTGVGSRV